MDKNKRAVQVIEHAHKFGPENINSVLKDGYWVILCAQLKEAKQGTDLAYFAELDHSQKVYKALKDDSDFRRELFSSSRCNFTDDQTFISDKVI